VLTAWAVTTNPGKRRRPELHPPGPFALRSAPMQILHKLLALFRRKHVAASAEVVPTTAADPSAMLPRSVRQPVVATLMSEPWEEIAGFTYRRVSIRAWDEASLRKERERLARLKTHGPEPESQDSDGRSVYISCPAEYRRRNGLLEIRDDGIAFKGDVAIEIPWKNVAHLAQGDTDDAEDVLAVQEGKRRTATRFALFGNDSAYALYVAFRVWGRAKAGSLSAAPDRPHVTRESPTCDLSTSDGSCDFHIVGESNYQPELRNVSQSGREFIARLAHESSNRFDPNAIRVCSPRGRTIGYLNREHALDYREAFAMLAQHGREGQCRAKLIGGVGLKKSFGVLLNLADPESLLMRIRDSVAPGTIAPSSVQPF
jgi:hypothetical protein